MQWLPHPNNPAPLACGRLGFGGLARSTVNQVLIGEPRTVLPAPVIGSVPPHVCIADCAISYYAHGIGIASHCPAHAPGCTGPPLLQVTLAPTSAR